VLLLLLVLVVLLFPLLRCQGLRSLLVADKHMGFG
jgi:hypothetical protein